MFGPNPRNGTCVVIDFFQRNGSLSFGERLRSFRGRAGLTQHEFAERTGISVRALRDLENGRVEQPRGRTLRGLATLLSVDVDEVRELLVACRRTVPSGDEGLRVDILGTLSVRHGGNVREISATKLRRLLGLLALHHPDPVGFEEIRRTLWPKNPPRSSQNLIHTYISQLRGVLLPPGSRPVAPAASCLTRTPGGYVLALERDQVDLTRFLDLAARARQAHDEGDSATAYELAGRACRCWRGPILADEPLLAHHPEATAAARKGTENLLLHADLAMQFRQPEQVVHALRGAAREEPLHEGLQARLILALASCGQQSEALNVFADVVRRLDAELGVEPGEELRHAHLRVLHQQLPSPRGGRLTRALTDGPTAARSPDLSAAVPVPNPMPPTSRPSQLPAEPMIFVGRAAEMRKLDRLLSAPGERGGHVPAALITGLPGVGKTTLALRWAHRRERAFPDGQLYVDLRGHSVRPPLRPEEALHSFLRALGVPRARIPDSPDEAANLYRTVLSGRRVLVVLDNAGDEEQIRPLIPGGADCAVLVTSRNTLPGLVARQGVRRVGLDLLTQNESVGLLARLLGQRRVDAEPLAAAALARYCGGLPPAVRILGARLAELPGLSIAQYCVELQDIEFFRRQGCEDDDLFSSVQAAFALSYAALPESARRFFRLLGRTEGRNVTAYTMADLAGTTPREALRALRRLVEASLLHERAHALFTVPGPLLRYAEALDRHDDPHLPSDAAS